VTVCTKPPLEFISAVSGGDWDDFDEIGQHLFDLIRGRCNAKPGDHILDTLSQVFQRRVMEKYLGAKQPFPC